MTHGFLSLVLLSILAQPSGREFQAASSFKHGTDALSLEKLATLSHSELDALFRSSSPGRPPSGVLRGRAIYDSEERFAKARSAATNAIWLGKEFDADSGMLINRWRLGRAIKAEVYAGESWLDGGPALIMDYRKTSLVWRNVRDELREVAPGLYLGAMFRCDSSGARFVMFFALAECPR